MSILRCVVSGVAVLVSLGGASVVLANVIHVPGEIPTVHGACAVAVAGDTVFIDIGLYWEDTLPAILQSGVTVLGSGDAIQAETLTFASTLMNFGFICYPGAEEVLVENLWFGTYGLQSWAPQTIVRGCRFEPFLEGPEYYPVLVEMLGGGLVEGSAFHNRDLAEWMTHCIRVAAGYVEIRGNIFNSIVYPIGVYDTSGLLESVVIRNNTFGTSGPPVEFWYDAEGEVVSNVFYSVGVSCAPTASVRIAHNCFGWEWYLPGPNCAVSQADSNFVADPMICGDWQNFPNGFTHWDNYYLDAASPCVGTGEGGANIGALGIGCGTTAVSESPVPSVGLRLAVRPNPVLHGAHFTFDSSAHPVALEIYDPTGRLVEKLNPVGDVSWRPSRTAPRGVYFARLQGAGVTETVKFVVVR